MDATLDDATHDAIKRLCALGDEHSQRGEYDAALGQYWKAWDLLPEPRTEWEAATWILAAIGDANFASRNYEAGRDNLSNAMHCPGAIGNPFLHMRLGQCQLELGNQDRAADELMRAYMGAGTDIFKDQDPKYIAFLKTRAKDIDEPTPKRKPWQFWK